MAGEWTGRRAIVLGLGHFGGGLGVARWLLAQGADVLVTDRASPETLAGPASDLAARGARLRLGGHEDVDFAAADLLVVNPAVPPQAPPLAAARAAGVRIATEIGLLIERWPGPVVGVTGSNGKSTTTSLIHAVLRAAGAPAELGGNIGGSLLESLDRVAPRTIAVLEISSFMLELLAPAGLLPDVAVITNVTPNHLDRHGSFEAYKAAKRAILGRARHAVLCGDDPVVREIAAGWGGQPLWYGRRGDMSVNAAGDLVDRRGWIVLEDARIPLPGRVNRVNLAGATLAAAAALGDEVRATRALPAALAGYELPPHRLQTVGTWRGVAWIDDSVSTTPESTAASLEALGGGCLLIAGGHDKGLDPGALVEAAARHARVVLTVGEQGPRLVRDLSRRGVVAELVGTVEAAVERAALLARPGESVLLSPGYSSHDQFTNYEHRAAVFRASVLRLASRDSAGGSDRAADAPA